jgi:hypothetical protein
MAKKLFHYRKWYKYILQPLADVLDAYVNASGKKMYTELPTYKIVVVGRCSRNLEPPSHPPVAACMNRVEPLLLLQMALPKLGKACVDL